MIMGYCFFYFWAQVNDCCASFSGVCVKIRGGEGKGGGGGGMLLFT